jgi:hypothetical protein
MAKDIKRIQIGGAQLSMGSWVAAGAAGSLTEVGILKQGSELTPTRELYMPDFESFQSPIAAFVTKQTWALKAVMAEAAVSLLREILAQPAANLTGLSPNETLVIGESTYEEYLQLELLGGGPMGTGYVRGDATVTVWKAVLQSLDPIMFSKGQEQLFGATFACLLDPTISTPAVMDYQIANAA